MKALTENKMLLAIILIALVILGLNMNKSRAEKEATKVEEESIDPGFIKQGDDLLARIEVFEEYAQKQDPDARLVAIDYRAEDSCYALLFEADRFQIVYYIDVR